MCNMVQLYKKVVPYYCHVNSQLETCNALLLNLGYQTIQLQWKLWETETCTEPEQKITERECSAYFFGMYLIYLLW